MTNTKSTKTTITVSLPTEITLERLQYTYIEAEDYNVEMAGQYLGIVGHEVPSKQERGAEAYWNWSTTLVPSTVESPRYRTRRQAIVGLITAIREYR